MHDLFRARSRVIAPNIAWSISGHDSGGGAGLAADQRAFDAFGVHMCPIVAAMTAQNSVGISRVQAVDSTLVDAQLTALFDDMPPSVVKTGLLGSVDNVMLVARWIRKLRLRGDVALVVDPVFASSTGVAFGGDDLVRAYAAHLLPLATIITPNRAEAERLRQALHGPKYSSSHQADAQEDAETDADTARAVAATGCSIQTRTAAALCITGGDSIGRSPLAIDWFSSGEPIEREMPQAEQRPAGWLASPRIRTRHTHGTGCTFASSVASGMALGHAAADAVVLAKMATTQALMNGHAAGSGAGPVMAGRGFAAHASLLPQVSWGTAPCFEPGFAPCYAPCYAPWLAPCSAIAQSPNPLTSREHARSGSAIEPGLYGIVDDISALDRAFRAGFRTMQLRIKTPPFADLEWHARLEQTLAKAASLAHRHRARVFINDHREQALDLHAMGYPIGLHMGQGDLLALTGDERQSLIDLGIPLGISSHSLWELCRARAMSPAYIACGPVWHTNSKQMPWKPQGLDNLAWWVSMAGCPVAAIGGVVTTGRIEQAARAGARLICLMSLLTSADAHAGPDALPEQAEDWQLAWTRGHEKRASDRCPSW